MLQNVRFVLPGPSKHRSWGPGTSFLLRGIGPGKNVSICTFFLQRWIYISTESLCQVKHNFFLFRELLSFWVGSSLSLYWEGLIIKSIDIIDQTCVTWFVLFWSIKSYLPPTQIMKCLCLCIVFAKYKMLDFVVNLIGWTKETEG